MLFLPSLVFAKDCSCLFRDLALVEEVLSLQNVDPSLTEHFTKEIQRIYSSAIE